MRSAITISGSWVITSRAKFLVCRVNTRMEGPIPDICANFNNVLRVANPGNPMCIGSVLPNFFMRVSQSKMAVASKQNCVAIYTSISVFRDQAFLSRKAMSIPEFDISGDPSGCPATPIFLIQYFSNNPELRICIVL